MSDDPEVDWYTRSNLAEAVVARARQQGEQALEESLDWLASMVKDENEDWEFRFSAANMLLNFPRERYRDLLYQMYTLQDSFMKIFDKKEIDEAYQNMEDQPAWEEDRDLYGFYQPMTILDRQQQWLKQRAWAEQEALESDPFEDALLDEEMMDDPLFNESADDSFWGGSEPYRRDIPKVGRNDPCPCGSGKKFKKCCLH